MTDRIRTILAAGDAAGLPEIARVLALDTSLEPEAAATVFSAAQKDVATASAQPGTVAEHVASAPAAPGTNHSFGVADKVGGDAGAEVIKAGWGKAVAQVNARFN